MLRRQFAVQQNPDHGLAPCSGHIGDRVGLQRTLARDIRRMPLRLTAPQPHRLTVRLYTNRAFHWRPFVGAVSCSSVRVQVWVWPVTRSPPGQRRSAGTWCATSRRPT